jgi:hypothetical protein
MHYRSRVEKILTEADPAGRGDRADVVISAADGHATILNMLEGRFISERSAAIMRSAVLQTHPRGLIAAVGRNPCLPTPYARGVGAG